MNHCPLNIKDVPEIHNGSLVQSEFFLKGHFLKPNDTICLKKSPQDHYQIVGINDPLVYNKILIIKTVCKWVDPTDIELETKKVKNKS